MDGFWHGAIGAIIGGLLTAYIAWRNAERSIEIKQITEERAKWREKIRSLVEEIVVLYCQSNRSPKAIATYRCRLVTSLNPKDRHDKEIVDHFDSLFFNEHDDNDTSIKRFTRRISLLLKHDWERVKWDCLSWFKKKEITLYIPESELEWKKDNYRDIANTSTSRPKSTQS